MGRKEREKEVFIEEALHLKEIGLMKIRVWAFKKMKMQRVKRKSFEQPT